MTDPFESPMEFLKAAEKGPPEEDGIPQELRELLANALPNAKVTVIGPQGQEIPMDPGTHPGLATALQELFDKANRKNLTIQAVEAVAKLLEEDDDSKTKVMEAEDPAELLRVLSIDTASANQIVQDATKLSQTTFLEVFNEDATQTLIHDTDLLEKVILQSVAFFVVGIQYERLRQQSVTSTEKQSGDPQPPQDL